MKKENIRIVEVPVTTVKGKGKNKEITYNVGADMASADPIRYSRLIKAGKIKEAKAMVEDKGFNVIDEDGEYLQIKK